MAPRQGLTYRRVVPFERQDAAEILQEAVQRRRITLNVRDGIGNPMQPYSSEVITRITVIGMLHRMPCRQLVEMRSSIDFIQRPRMVDVGHGEHWRVGLLLGLDCGGTPVLEKSERTDTYSAKLARSTKLRRPAETHEVIAELARSIPPRHRLRRAPDPSSPATDRSRPGSLRHRPSSAPFPGGPCRESRRSDDSVPEGGRRAPHTGVQPVPCLALPVVTASGARTRMQSCGFGSVNQMQFGGSSKRADDPRDVFLDRHRWQANDGLGLSDLAGYVASGKRIDD